MTLSRSLRRALPLAGALACLWPVAADASTPSPLGTWNVSEQRTVVADGLMGNEPDGAFDGQLALSATDMQSILPALAHRPGITRLNGWNDLTVAGFDAAMVDALGLGSVASHVEAVASTAGLHPPRYFGTEVVARELGLRVDHPSGQDALELYPTDPITRAEAAHSLAKIASQGPWVAAGFRTLLMGFALPAYSAAQLGPLSVAVSKIGMPYVWGGVADTATATQVHGGYDCSGLIWRSFKLAGDAAGAPIHGRTAAQMANEVARTARVPLSALAPGDLVFFGTAGFAGTATEASVTHSAIALSSQWAIESSGQGVNVAPLTSGWLRTSFAWGRHMFTGVSVAAVTTAPPAHRASPPAHRTRTPVHKTNSSPPTKAAPKPAPAGVTGGQAAGGSTSSSPAVGPTGGAGFPG